MSNQKERLKRLRSGLTTRNGTEKREKFDTYALEKKGQNKLISINKI